MTFKQDSNLQPPSKIWGSNQLSYKIYKWRFQYSNSCCLSSLLCCERDLNPQPHVYKTSALTTCAIAAIKNYLYQFHLGQCVHPKASGSSFLMATRLCQLQHELCGMFSGITHNAYANPILSLQLVHINNFQVGKGRVELPSKDFQSSAQTTFATAPIQYTLL